MILFHHDDKKEEFQSHEVWNDAFEDEFNTGIKGYGKDFSEALLNYEIAIKEWKESIDSFLSDTTIEAVIEVDCLGYELKDI